MSGTRARNFFSSSGSGESVERIPAWECVGCGKIEGPQPCIGVCRDRKTEFVYAADYDEVLDVLTDSRRQREILLALVRQISCTTPREGAWELTYRAMQARARQILEDLAEKVHPPKGSDHA